MGTIKQKDHMLDEHHLVKMADDDIQRNVVGFSTPGSGPVSAQQMGWTCPAPSINDWEDYKKWKADQAKMETLPCAPQVFFTDWDLLFHTEPDIDMKWSMRLKCEIRRKVDCVGREIPVKASYISCQENDNFGKFEELMGDIRISAFRRIKIDNVTKFALAHIEQSDLIVIDGCGVDRKTLWETFCHQGSLAEAVKWRYYCGTTIVSMGNAMGLLGQTSWYRHEGRCIPHEGWKTFPLSVTHDDAEDLEDIMENHICVKPGAVVFALSKGGGMIFNTDGLLEPLRHCVMEYRYCWKSECVKRAVLFPPPRSTGLLCPLYGAQLHEGDTCLEGAPPCVLTPGEEAEEEILWIREKGRVFLPRVAEFTNAKDRGNAAFKGKRYHDALKEYLAAKAHLDAESRYPTTDEEDNSSALRIALLLNLSATYLLLDDDLHTT
eukprot:GEMP01051576.1.p1 GENE.GEMP01051576.1~~GEMP01051576.1.p1  ORF type:complete len:435 (+),score=96.96 GEMP01051576.1:112-1416(+)